MSNAEISGFHEAWPFTAAGITLPVYVSSAGERPVVVLHELPGMSEPFIAFCRQLAGDGYKVHMPLMFKSPGTEMGNLQSAAFCVSREFRSLFAARGDGSGARPFTAWMLDLVGRVSDEHRDANIGVIGMCLTGSFAVAAIAQPNVEAVIACQPSVPFFFGIETLGLSQEERDRVAARAGLSTKPCAKGYRYKNDMICRRSHMKAVENLLGGAFERYPDLPGCRHSTLTGDKPSEAVYRDVVQFLAARL